VTEAVTQAEQDLFYALLAFERYKAVFAVRIATEYLAVLRAGEQVRIAEGNRRRLDDGLARALALGEAGRLPATEVDQTRQDVLRARSRLVEARQQVDARLDALKLTLGLPVATRLALDAAEAARIEARVRAALAASAPQPAETSCVARACARRQDLAVAGGRAQDAARRVRVAATALRARLDVTLKASGQERRYEGGDTADVRFGDGSASAGAELEPPWDRTADRNAYRNALIARDRAQRAVDLQQDQIVKEVRDALRALDEARETYAIQQRAVELAERRVRSAQMFLEAGRAQTRDVLEAEEALVSAQNALADAVVAFRVAGWTLARDTGELEADDSGRWNLEEQP
jgi:outer membrane protein TolC